ncbi:MAG: hypothetical protein ACFE0I_09075 [Elainellaceae cyanobacterium]
MTVRVWVPQCILLMVMSLFGLASPSVAEPTLASEVASTVDERSPLSSVSGVPGPSLENIPVHNSTFTTISDLGGLRLLEQDEAEFAVSELASTRRWAESNAAWVRDSVTNTGVGFRASAQPTQVSYLISPTYLEQEVVESELDSEDVFLSNESVMGQVTSVTQLSDVQPTDWAYEAVRSLVEQYGCIVRISRRYISGRSRIDSL